MNQNTYTVKEIAFFTGLSEAKIRTLIKAGTIKAELVDTVNDTGRKVKRLEVTEENMAAFAFANPELAGPLTEMEIIKAYAPKELDVAEPSSEVAENTEEIGNTPNDGWGPAEFTDDDVIDEGDGVNENDEPSVVNTTPTIAAETVNENPEEQANSEKDELLASLRSIQKPIIDTIGAIDDELKYYTNLVNELTSKSADLANQLNVIERAIKHIEEHM